MPIIRQFLPYIFFAVFAAIAFVYGTGFAWTAGVKFVVATVLIVLFMEKMFGEEVLRMTARYKLSTLVISHILAGSMYYYGFNMMSVIDYSGDMSEVRTAFENAMLIMSTAGIPFTFGGATLFRK